MMSYKGRDMGKNKYVKKIEKFDWSQFIDLKTHPDFKEKTIIEAEVIALNMQKIICRIPNGYGDCILPRCEFRDLPLLNIGDKVKLYVEKWCTKTGVFLVSHKKARMYQFWDDVNNAYESQSIVKGHIKCWYIDGFIVDILGIDAFLPSSEIDGHPVPMHDIDKYVNIDMDFKIVLVDKIHWNVVVSHRVANGEEFMISSFADELHFFESNQLPDNDDDDYDKWVADAFDNKVDDDEEDMDIINVKKKNSYAIPPISEMFRTHGSISPCPHCGSNSIRTYSDGTAQCKKCQKWYYYA